VILSLIKAQIFLKTDMSFCSGLLALVVKILVRLLLAVLLLILDIMLLTLITLMIFQLLFAGMTVTQTALKNFAWQLFAVVAQNILLWSDPKALRTDLSSCFNTYKRLGLGKIGDNFLMTMAL